MIKFMMGIIVATVASFAHDSSEIRLVKWHNLVTKGM